MALQDWEKAKHLGAKRFLLDEGTDTTAGSGYVELSSVVDTDGFEALILDVAVTALVNNGATALYYGIETYDADENIIWPLADSPASNRLALLWSTIATPMRGAVAIGPRMSNYEGGGGANGNHYITRPHAVPMKARVRRLTTGGSGLTSVSTTWRLYGLGEI